MTPPQEQDPRLERLDPFPGRVVAGNFRIDKLIGAGAMGNVYKAEQLSLSKPVAVKVLHAHLHSDEKLVTRFKREAKSASLLNHPNSIQIIDSGQDADGTLYIAMELLTGRDLAQVIRDDFPLSLSRVVRIMTQVMSALDEAHARGVIHRDLKPSNIMLIELRGQRDFVKVCDFGIAKATAVEDDRAQMLTIQGLVCGTPEYMSPEQARAEAIDGRADLYSAAVILYQLLTGDIPFRAETPMGIISRHLSEAPLPPSVRRPDLRLPKAVDEIVMRGLEKDRELRFPTAIAFRDALEVMLNATAGPATPLPPSVRASMPTARDISGADIAIAVTALAGGTGKVPAQGGAQEPRPHGAESGRRQKAIVLSLVALLFVGSGVAGVVTARLRREQLRAAATAPAIIMPILPPAPAASVPVLPPAPVAAGPAPAASPPPPEPAPVAPFRERAKHRRPAALAAEAPVAPPAEPAATAPMAATVTPPPVPVVEAPPPRGTREVLAEADKLLGQGEVTDACARGEEAKRMNASLPATYKFLGKCYMRAGRASEATTNYKRYLDLAPNAPDAPFIKSIIK
jgi:eukaryotic-like serine/threonine-protein kinase